MKKALTLVFASLLCSASCIEALAFRPETVETVKEVTDPSAAVQTALAEEDENTVDGYLKNDPAFGTLYYYNNSYHALALKLATKEEIETIKTLAFKVNEVLKKYFLGLGIELVDFKLEFGRTSDGKIVLADEISPDTCRFWDSKTHEKLDKDRFRRDLGHVEDAYIEIRKRLLGE